LHRLEVGPAGAKKPALPELALAPDGKTVAAGTSDGTISVWDVPSGKRLWQLRRHRDAVALLSFTADGKTLITTGNDLVTLWSDAASGRELRKASLPAGGGRPLASCQDGRLLASGDDTIRVWDVAAGKQRCRVTPAGTVTVGVALSADGRFLAERAWSGVVLWDATDGSERRFFGMARGVDGGAVAFSPDGSLLATAQGDGVVLWETATGTMLTRLSGHRGPLAALAFSPDGGTLVTSGGDTTLLVWRVTSLLRKAPRK
jgi:WD40 repeat protein